MLPQTRDEAVDYLLGCINYERQSPVDYREREFKLDTMRALADRLGNPQTAYPVIHIAGTKGKGSTAAMTAAMLQRAGFRVGLYTSPHLHRLEERMVINGQEIEAESLVSTVQRLKVAADQLCQEISEGRFVGNRPTFFELVTLTAWLYFRSAGVDIAVVEVGLGGRLDSTNICEPRLGIITSISKDHTQQLGDTLGEIATEKAGIIKPGMKLISGVLNDEPAAVIRETCRRKGVELLELGRDFEVRPVEPAKTPLATPQPLGLQKSLSHEIRGGRGGAQTDVRDDFREGAIAQVFDYKILAAGLGAIAEMDGASALPLAVAGDHQRQNASLAVTAALLCREFDRPVSLDAIRLGLPGCAASGTDRNASRSPEGRGRCGS